MAFYASYPYCMARFVFYTLALVLCLAGLCFGQTMPSGETTQPAASTFNLRALITGTCEEIHHYVESTVGTNVITSTVESAVFYLESVLGQENVYAMAMFFTMLIRFLAQGAASGLNVIAVYVTEILRVTGVDVALPFPHFTPEGVASVAQWGLLALIGYWVVSIILRLLVGVLRQVFWVVKTVLALWFFGLIVADRSAAVDVTAVRLVVLVVVYSLLGLATVGSEKSVTVENRLSRLEARLKAVAKSSEDE
ncbi:uncharacterized protein FYW47_014098 isoform 1-T1 [Aplochiton taeniatus]